MPGRHTSPRRARQQAFLKQVGLVYVFERIARLAQRSRQSLDADRTAVVVVDDHGQVATVHLIETRRIDIEALERFARRLCIYLAVRQDLREVARTAKQAICDARSASRTPSKLLCGLSTDREREQTRASPMIDRRASSG